MHFCMKRLRTLKFLQKFKIRIKNSKTYSGCCPFPGLSNGTILMQIQSGRTVPLRVPVVGKEKKGGSRCLQWLGISLGLWRSMSIFVLNMLFVIEKCTSISALSSKLNRWFVWIDKKRCGSNKTFLLITRQLISAPNVQSMKRTAVWTQKKSAIPKLFHN